VVDVVGARRSRSRHGRHDLWSTWSELGRTARDVVDVVRGRRGPWSARHGSLVARHGPLSGSTRLASASSWPTGWLEQLDVARLWLGVACSAARSVARSVARAAPLLPNYGSVDLATDTPGQSSNDVMMTAPPAKSSSNHIDMDIPNVYVYTFHRKVY